MSLGQSIRHGAVWLFIGNTGSQALTFLFGIVLARLLAPSDFGMLITISVFTGLAGFISGGGMGQALVRAKEVTKKDYDITFTLQIIIGCLIYASFFFTAPWFAKWYNTPLYADLLRVSALSFIFRPFVNLPSSILHREMRFKAGSGVRIATLLLSSTVSIAMAYKDYGVWSLIAGGIVGSAASAILFSSLAKWRPGWSLDFSRGRDIARYGFMVSANDIVIYLRSQSSNFVLSRTLGPASVGLFNKADSLSSIPFVTISGSVYDPLFRSLAKSSDNADLVKYLYLRSIKLICIYTFPAYVLLYWLADELIHVLYGAKWAGAAAPLSILVIAGFFMSISHPAGAVLSALNKLRQELFVSLISFATVIAGLAISIKYGITGVAWAMVVSYAATSFHMSLAASKAANIRLADISRAVLPAVYQGCAIFLVLFLLDTGGQDIINTPIPKILIYGITAVVTFALTSFFSPFEDLREESKKWGRAVLTILKSGNKQSRQDS